MKKTSIKNLFFRRSLLLSFVPLLLALVLVYFQVQSKIEEKLNSEFQLISQQLTHQIEEHLEDNLNALRYLTQTPLVREHILNEWDRDARVRELFLAFLNSHPDFQSVHLIQTRPELRYFASTQAIKVTSAIPQAIKEELRHSLKEAQKLEKVELQVSKGIAKWDVLLGFTAEDEEFHFLEAEINLEPVIQQANSLQVMNLKQGPLNRLLILDPSNRVLNPLSPSDQLPFEGGSNTLVHENFVMRVGLNIVVAVDKSLAYQDLKSLFLIFLFPFVAMIVLIVFSSALTASKLSNPILDLQMMSQELARGQEVSAPSASNIIELENLALSMKKMGEQIEIKELELKKAARDLEQNVQSRSKKYLELYEEYKGLLQMLSHDLSNIIQSLQISLENSRQSRQTEDLNPEVYSLLGKAGKFLKKFKEMEAIQEGYQDFVEEEVLLDEVFEDLKILFAPKLRSKNIELQISNLHRAVYLKIDREWFTMTVLANVMSNAIKFSYPGGLIEIQVSLHDSGSRVCLRVIDHGVGIERDRLDKLMSAGRVHRTSLGTRGEVGTGFGLILASKVLEEMGGSLGIISVFEQENPVKHGTCVLIEVNGYANSDS